MQILVVFFFAGLVGCFGEESECVKNAKSCVADFLQKIVDGASDDELCREMIKSLDCAEGVVEICTGEEKDELKEGIELMQKAKSETCSRITEISEEFESCFDAHKEKLFMSCMLERNNGLPIGDRCEFYVTTGKCMIKGLKEKCGTEVAEEASRRELSAVPVELMNACEEAGVVLGPGIFDEDKKKK